jgi:Flp pilus assembly protein TadG
VRGPAAGQPSRKPWRTLLDARRPDQRGAALVEFALCLPVLTILVFGVIDVGRAYVLLESLQNAAHEAAAYAAVHPGQQKVATGACADPANADWRGTREGKADSTLTFTYTPSVACTSDPAVLAAANLAPGQPLKVKATKTMQVLTPLFTSNLTISATVCVSVSGATPTGTCP